jgi:putative FmdB family regulatory protein
MPIYVYRPTAPGCAACRDGIERLQRLADPPLAACPECGATLERVIGGTQVVAGQTHVLRENNLAKHGFTQYRRVGKGKYEKTAGKGPSKLSDD